MARLIRGILQPPHALAGLQAAAGIGANMRHLFFHGQAPELVVRNSHFLKERLLGWKLNLEARNVGSADMHDALFILAPLRFRNAAHFAEHEVDFLDLMDAIGFQHAVGDAAPCIVRREFHFDAEFPNSDIGEGLRMRIKINRSLRAENFLGDFSDTILEFSGTLKRRFSRLHSQFLTDGIQYLFKFLLGHDIKYHALETPESPPAILDLF